MASACSSAAISLALGIGANTVIFSDTTLLRPLPYPDAGRLVMIWTVPLQHPDPATTPSNPRYFVNLTTLNIFTM